MKFTRKTTFSVVLVIAVICLLRFAFFYDAYLDDPNLVIDPDTKSYIDISTNLFENGRYERVHGEPEIHRPPAYPLFLTLSYALFGQDNLLAPVILQHILFFAMMLIVAHLAFQMGGTLAMTIAIGLLTLDFTTFYYVNEILSELMFAFFITLAIATFYAAMKSFNRQIMLFFLTGLILTIAIFVRPVGLYLVYPITLYVAVIAYLDSEKIAHSVKSAAVFFLPWLILGGAWYFYSFSVSGNFTFTSYESGGVYGQRLAAVLQSSLGIDIGAANQMVNDRMRNTDSHLLTFITMLSEHPAAAFKVTITDIGRQLLSPGQWYLKFYFPSIFDNQFPLENLLFDLNFSEISARLAMRPAMYLPIVGFVFLHLIIIYAGVMLSVTGVRKMSFENLTIYVLMVLFIGYFVAITLGFIGHSRFRVPFMPALAILSGYGFSLLFRRNKSNVDWE